jgi:hypothetical protein
VLDIGAIDPTKSSAGAVTTVAAPPTELVLPVAGADVTAAAVPEVAAVSVVPHFMVLAPSSVAQKLPVGNASADSVSCDARLDGATAIGKIASIRFVPSRDGTRSRAPVAACEMGGVES